MCCDVDFIVRETTKTCQLERGLINVDCSGFKWFVCLFSPRLKRNYVVIHIYTNEDDHVIIYLYKIFI